MSTPQNQAEYVLRTGTLRNARGATRAHYDVRYGSTYNIYAMLGEYTPIKDPKRLAAYAQVAAGSKPRR